MPVFFTPQSANAVLPEVEEAVKKVIAIKQGSEDVPEAEMTESMVKLEREMQKIEDLGCVLKDLNQGLIDFPAVRLGTRVWLCWKLGEKSVVFWHGLQDGFAGRQRAKDEDFYTDDLAIKSLSHEVISKPQI